MIRKNRIIKRLTQKSLGTQLGTSQGYISKLENKNCKKINIYLILNLSNILDLDLHELIDWLLDI